MSYQCHQCHHQTSLTAGTIFHGTKLPLRAWFLAIYLLTQRKKSTSALQLSRELGVKYDTAWRLKHKLMQVMLERVRQQSLGGRIEMDDAYLGGERAGKRGRGSRNKIPFIAAVETTQDGRPLKVHLRRVTGFRKTEIARYAQASILPGSEVVSDGLHCFSGVTAAHCRHVPLINVRAYRDCLRVRLVHIGRKARGYWPLKCLAIRSVVLGITAGMAGV